MTCVDASKSQGEIDELKNRAPKGLDQDLIVQLIALHSRIKRVLIQSIKKIKNIYYRLAVTRALNKGNTTKFILSTLLFIFYFHQHYFVLPFP